MGLTLALGAVVGCASEEPDPGSVVDEATDHPVIAAEIGGSYDLHVEPRAVAGEHGALVVLAFPVTAGQPFAAVMRRTDQGALDPWLALYVGGERVAVSDWDQAVVPMAAEDDAVIVYTPQEEGELFVVASDLDMKARGDFQLDLVALEAPATEMAFHLTNPATRALTDVLRDREPQTLAYLEPGMVSEGADGLLISHPLEAPSLKERAALQGFVAAVNEERAQLFEEIVRANEAGEPSVELSGEPGEAGAVCGALWDGLRSETHQLR